MPVALEREPITAAEQERPNLAKIENFLTELDNRSKFSLPWLVGPAGEEIELPESVFHLLRQVVHDSAEGSSVTIVPVLKIPVV